VEYPNQAFYAIFDESVRSKQRLGQRSGMAWNSVHGVYQWSEDSCDEIEKGWVLKGDMIKELPAKTKIDPDRLQETSPARSDRWGFAVRGFQHLMGFCDIFSI